MPKRIDAAVKERALRMYADHCGDYPSDTALSEAVAKKLGVGRETTWRWLVQADVNAGTRPGTASDDQAEIKRLEAEARKSCVRTTRFSRPQRFSSPRNLTPATADHGVHRRHEN